MKAVKITAVRQMEVVEVDSEEPQAGEVKIRLQYVGFCGSDLST